VLQAQHTTCLLASLQGDPRVRGILQERYGITDMATVLCDTWACHGAPEHLNQRRLMQAFLYLRTRPGDNE
jgi:primary-amine oxidase